MHLAKAKGLGVCAPMLNSVPRSAIADAKLSAPVLEAHRAAVDGYVPSISPVVDLLLVRRPSAILFEVAKIVIYPINRKTLWRFTHIVKEVLEGLQPSFTNGYTSTYVVLCLLGKWVAAPVLHGLPALVRRSFGHAVHIPLLGLYASARLNATFSEVIASHCSRLSAFTHAVPVRMTALKRSANHLESPINITGPVDLSEGHNAFSVGVLC